MHHKHWTDWKSVPYWSQRQGNLSFRLVMSLTSYAILGKFIQLTNIDHMLHTKQFSEGTTVIETDKIPGS